MFDGIRLYEIMFEVMEEGHPGEAQPYEVLGDEERIVLDQTALGILKYLRTQGWGKVPGHKTETHDFVTEEGASFEFYMHDDEDLDS